MLSPRENMLRTIRCEDAEWIPITIYVDPYNHPNPDSLPESLGDLFREKISSWERRCELFIPISEHLGVNEYLIDAPNPYKTICTNGVEEFTHQENEDLISVIKTSKGELSQIAKYGSIKKHYIEGIEDLEIFIEYVRSWQIEEIPNNIAETKRTKDLIGDNGIIRGFGVGTPLGMMYRKYANVTDLIYLIADYPDEVKELFDVMEAKYLKIYEFILKNCPEIDILRGMDDTSTSIVSPEMFENYNIELTNKRVELVHKYGKLYLHHSCGLIHDLLPIYKKTKIDGVDSFTPPPIGDVTYSEGRELVGDNISFNSSFHSGLYHPDKDTYRKTVRRNLEDAKKAGHIMFELSTPDNLHDISFMEIGLEEARKYLKY